MKSGMASSSVFSSTFKVLPLSPEISISLSKFAGMYSAGAILSLHLADLAPCVVRWISVYVRTNDCFA